MNINAMMKECAKPHALAHLVSGAGLGLLVLYFVPSLTSYLLVLGLVLLVGGVVWDYFAQSKK